MTSAGEGFEKWDAPYGGAIRRCVDWLSRGVGVAPGLRVLDVGSGTGHPARPLWARVQPGGSVLATDVDADMLAAAGRLAHAEGIHLERRVMDAQRLDLPDASFDAVTSAFALMFCSDPALAVREMHRVLAPGGRLAIAVWDLPERNPFFTAFLGPFTRLGVLPAPEAGGPGPFRLAAPGVLAEIIRDAGFAEPRVESVAGAFESASAEEHWQMLVDCATPVRRALAQMSAVEAAEARAAVLEALLPHAAEDGRLRVPMVALCLAAQKPHV
jgi:ubiquinone/menaquinone biosynthesis C-methylase UbiE